MTLPLAALFVGPDASEHNPAVADPGPTAPDTVEGIDPQTGAELFPLMYGELRRLARAKLRSGGRGNLTLGTATLLHETYLHLVRSNARPAFPSRGHFMAYTARVMRTMIVNHVRRRGRVKRGGLCEFVTLDTEVQGGDQAGHIVQVDEHLRELQAIAPELAQLVEFKFFCGFTLGEIAQMRGCSERTVQRDWDKARGLLEAMIRGKVLLIAG